MFYLGVVYGKLKTSNSKHEIVESEVEVYLRRLARNQMQPIQKEMSV